MSQDKYKVHISPKAQSMMKQHLLFLDNVSTTASENLKNEFKDRIKSLSFMPNRCPWIEAENIPSGKYRKLIISNRYLIIFTTNDFDVFVEYIIDTRQNYSSLIE